MRTADSNLTVEELAARVGLPISTVRMYQSKGLLRAPRRVGRTARYDSSHLQRLELVQRLQDRGFSLASIAELLTAREQGATVADLLALPGGPEDWVPLGVGDIRLMIKPKGLRPALLRKATRLGLIRWRRGRPQTRRWTLSSGLRVAELDLPPSEVLDQIVRLRAHTDQIAADFGDIFERTLWPRIQVGSTETDQLDRTRALLQELTSLAEGVVVSALRESVRHLAEEFVERHELLPVGGERPDWLDHSIPVLSERLLEAREDDSEDVDQFLAADHAQEQ
ncbi:MerR family transcriptional regulator [Nocardia sp. MDA0666]|uniref:MerR family transcriptional regulator n=1 Tax=Nocardia sp. MDA0666 TaxID=2135448 RepID=UPI000D12722E|nr:MerR family transcriptional regulator [Nocardia sp. MDA0666]PSR58909.1 MerR family transcriptional regulator [Nocardia sp. MDA0666]